MRFRYLFMGFGSAAILGTLLATDPDKGLMTGMFLMSLAVGVVAVAAAHLSRRGLFDYLDMMIVAFRAMKKKMDGSDDPDVSDGAAIGSGMVFLGVCIVIAALLGLFGKSANAAVPAQAYQYLPVLSAELNRVWPDTPDRAYMGGLIEHESACPRKSSCWKPTARLKTQREEGAGLGQLTRAWSKTGALRFDKLAEMRDAHPALRELSWATIYQRPDLQIRTMIVMVKADHRRFTGTATPLHFADAAYNGGWGGVQKERRACGLKAGCDPQRWFGHVERVCLKSTAPIYGTRSACDINRFHVIDVLKKAPAYRGLVLSEPEIGSGKHAIQREAPAVPGIHRVVLDSESLGPVEQVHGLAHELHQMKGLGVVGTLLFWGGPSAVLGAVSHESVAPVNGHPIWANSHVGQEVLERGPTLAHADSLVVVVRGRGSIWDAAPGMHAGPDVVGPSSAVAVGSVLTSCLPLQAPAGLDVPAAQSGRAGNPASAAIAHASPLVAALFIPDEFRDHKTFKPIADLHVFHGQSVDVNMQIVNDVIHTRTPQYRGLV